jgi:hypothetical protein
LLTLQATTLFGQVGTSLGQLGQADCACLVGVEQAFVSPGGAVQTRTELLIGGTITGSSGLRRGSQMLELRQQALRIGEQADNMVPDGGLEFLGLDTAAGTNGWTRRQNAVFAVTQV